MIGTALYSSFSLFFRVGISFSGTSSPGQPYHWNVVDLDNPLNPLTSPPDDIEKSYLPSSDLLIVIGRRFETRRSRPSVFCSSVAEGMVAVGRCCAQRSLEDYGRRTLRRREVGRLSSSWRMYGAERVIGRLSQIQSESDRERLTRRLYKVCKMLSNERMVDGSVKFALVVGREISRTFRAARG